MNGEVNYSKSELEASKKPNELLNVNSKVSREKVSNKEKLKLIVDSKGFTIVASILTFGMYYVYYLFCVEQTKENPFNKQSSTTYKTDAGGYDNDKEIKKLDKNIRESINDKNHKLEVFLNACGRMYKKGLYGIISILEIIVCSGFNSIEKLLLRITGQDIKINPIEKFRQKKAKDFLHHEERIRMFISSKIKEKSQEKTDGFYIESSLIRKFRVKGESCKDHYLTFMFVCSYLMISILTLGLFPVYHLVVREGWKDIEIINKLKSHANRYEFDEIIERLINSRGNLEYSVLLLNKENLSLSVNSIVDVFRTRLFKNSDIRKTITTFLMMITFGFFGIFVITQSLFNKSRIKIDEEDTRPSNYEITDSKREKIKLFFGDSKRDLNVAIKLASQRETSINNSFKNLVKAEDKIIQKFLKIISSDLYFWLFSFVFMLGSIVILSAIVYSTPLYYSYTSFWLFISFLATFWILFTKHINLLFL